MTVGNARLRSSYEPSTHLSRLNPRPGMAFELPPLPYAYDALEPHFAARTIIQHSASTLPDRPPTFTLI